MKSVMTACIAAGLAVFAACGTAPRQEAPPDWVSGAAAAYPAASYLLGRGAAGNLNEAEDRARADLAKGLEVEIKVETSDVQTFALNPDARKPGMADERMTLDVSRKIATRTDQIVRGIRIAETWRDPVAGTDHALAVLARDPALQALQADIGALDGATATEIERARNAGDPLSALAAASRAVERQLERAGVQRVLQVVDPSGLGIPPRWESARLRADRDSLSARLRIRPSAAGDETQAVAVALAGAVGEAGFVVVEQGEADYTLAAVLDLGDLGLKEGWYWVAGSLEIVLGDPSGGVRGTHRWDIKASGQDPQLAHQRALDQVEATLDRELRDTLIGFAGGD